MNILVLNKKKSGQAIVEFTLCMIIVLFMIFGTIMVFRWTGMDLADRRQAHEELLKTQDIEGDYSSGEGYKEGPLKQLDPYFHTPSRMNAIFNEE